MTDQAAQQTGEPPVSADTSTGRKAEGQVAAAEPAKFAMPALDGKGLGGAGRGMDLLSDVTLNVKIELGRTRMLVEDVLRLGEGAVVELEKLAGDPVDVYVNERHVARGEILVLNDNFCVRISEIVEGEERAKKSA